jgi:hypothetical protein
MNDFHRLLEVEEAEAWLEYLIATREASAENYGDVEFWAWARLRRRLRLAKEKQAELAPVA